VRLILLDVMYFCAGEVSVADIFAQLEREYHAAHANSSNSKAGAGKGAAGAKGKAGAGAGGSGGSAGGAGSAALPVRLDLMSLKRLLEYLRLSESGAVIKVLPRGCASVVIVYVVAAGGLLLRSCSAANWSAIRTRVRQECIETHLVLYLLLPYLDADADHCERCFCTAQVVGSEQEAGGPSYMVSMDGLVTLLQRRTIFSVASERFGFVSARIVGE
jgi:hypothetical protein